MKQREQQKALSKISAQAQLNITELQPDKNTYMHTQNKFMLLVKRKKTQTNYYHIVL